jgi:hypothetical protein
MANEIDYDPFYYVPLDQLKTPQDGATCYIDRWWLVDPNRGALVNSRYNNPQCHIKHEVMMAVHGHRMLDIVFIPVAYFKKDLTK